MRTSQVLRVIPKSASFVFEFNNNKSFYDIYNDNKLFSILIGKIGLDDLDTLKQQLLLNPLIEKYFTGQNIFISIHPENKNDLGLLFTIPAASGFDLLMPGKLNSYGKGISVTSFQSGSKPGFIFYIKSIKKNFYTVINDDNILSGSFSRQLINQTSAYKNDADNLAFDAVPEGENTNSMANLFINYNQLRPLFEQLFKNKNSDIFECLQRINGMASLSLNYRGDALMFNGPTDINKKVPFYLNLYTSQQPMVNHLKDIFPSSTAFSTNFAVSDPLKFEDDLSKWQTAGGVINERDQLFTKIRSEIGERFRYGFIHLLGNEYALVTTRYFEKFAIISTKDGSKLRALLVKISDMANENLGQFNYEKIPYFLLGDPFNNFKRPYFTVIDNYLILANSSGELASFYDSYIHRKFLSKNQKYNRFDYLLAERSNVAFLFNFRNAAPVLKRDMDTAVYNKIEKNEADYNNFYGASVQLSASNNNFYSNFCLKLNTDTTGMKSNK